MTAARARRRRALGGIDAGGNDAVPELAGDIALGLVVSRKFQHGDEFQTTEAISIMWQPPTGMRAGNTFFEAPTIAPVQRSVMVESVMKWSP